MGREINHIYTLNIEDQFEHFKKQIFPVQLGTMQEELMRRCFVAGWAYANVGLIENSLNPDIREADQEFKQMNKSLESFWANVIENDMITNLMNEINNDNPIDGEPA